MNTMILLIILVITGDEAHYFIAETESMADCMVKQSQIAAIVPKLTAKKPQFYTATCGVLVPYLTAT